MLKKLRVAGENAPPINPPQEGPNGDALGEDI